MLGSWGCDVCASHPQTTEAGRLPEPDTPSAEGCQRRALCSSDARPSGSFSEALLTGEQEPSPSPPSPRVTLLTSCPLHHPAPAPPRAAPPASSSPPGRPPCPTASTLRVWHLGLKGFTLTDTLPGCLWEEQRVRAAGKTSPGSNYGA